MRSPNDPLPERTPKACVEGRTIGVQRCPDLWLGGIAAAVGLGVWAYDRRWQPGVLAGLVAWPLAGVLYPLLVSLFGWPKLPQITVVLNALDLLDTVLGLLSIFS